MRSVQQPSSIDLILDAYDRFGILPAVTGGDDENKDGDGSGNPPDGDSAGNKGGGGGSGKSGGDGKSGDFRPITSQEDLDAVVIKRLRRQEKNLREEITADIKAELKAEADREAAQKEGNFQKLYEDAQDEIKNLKTKIKEMEDEVKASTIEELRAQVIEEFKLPEKLADRLRGETLEELKADAKTLVEVVVPREAPDTDTGKTFTGDNKPKTKDEKEAMKKPDYWGLPS